MSKIDRQKSTQDSIIPASEWQEGQNRRLRGDRLEIYFPLTLSLSDGSPLHGYAEAVNLSWAGLLLETNLILNEGETLQMEFILPQTQTAIHTSAKVVRRTNHPKIPEFNLVGVLFLEMDVNHRRMISGYVLERLPTA